MMQVPCMANSFRRDKVLVQALISALRVYPYPTLARATLKSQNLMETTLRVALTRGAIKKGKVGHGFKSNSTWCCSDKGVALAKRRGGCDLIKKQTNANQR